MTLEQKVEVKWKWNEHTAEASDGTPFVFYHAPEIRRVVICDFHLGHLSDEALAAAVKKEMGFDIVKYRTPENGQEFVNDATFDSENSAWVVYPC